MVADSVQRVTGETVEPSAGTLTDGILSSLKVAELLAILCRSLKTNVPLKRVSRAAFDSIESIYALFVEHGSLYGKTDAKTAMGGLIVRLRATADPSTRGVLRICHEPFVTSIWVDSGATDFCDNQVTPDCSIHLPDDVLRAILAGTASPRAVLAANLMRFEGALPLVAFLARIL